MTALTLHFLLTTNPTRFDGIHALLLAPFVLTLAVVIALAVAYVAGLLDGLVRLVDRHIDRAFRTDQIRKGETK